MMIETIGVCAPYCVCRLCIADEAARIKEGYRAEAQNYAQLTPAAQSAYDQLRRDVEADFRGPDEFSSRSHQEYPF